MTINSRNRLVVLLIMTTLFILAGLVRWMISTEVVLEWVATISIMSAMIMALFIFIMIILFFPKTNAPELILLLSYALGMLFQPMRFFLVLPNYISDHTLQSFGVVLAIFGYFLALSSLMFMGLVELNAIKIRVENFLVYFAVILYIFISLQPLQTTEAQKGYFLSFSNPNTLILLRGIFSFLIIILSLVLFFNREDSQKPYFAIAIILLASGLHISWGIHQLTLTILGSSLQITGFILFFLLIKRRYLWFRST